MSCVLIQLLATLGKQQQQKSSIDTGYDFDTGPLRTPDSDKPPHPVTTPEPTALAFAPPWYAIALIELAKNIREVSGPGDHPRIIEYRILGKTTDDGTTDDGSRPWCADFENAIVEMAGYPGTRSGMAQSFCKHKNFVRLDGPALGAIQVFWRGTPSSGTGHVNNYTGESADGKHVYGIGGNQGDGLTNAAFPRKTASFGLLGYWWPAGYPLPAKIGKVIRPMPGKASTKVT